MNFDLPKAEGKKVQSQSGFVGHLLPHTAQRTAPRLDNVQPLTPSTPFARNVTPVPIGKGLDQLPYTGCLPMRGTVLGALHRGIFPTPPLTLVRLAFLFPFHRKEH